MLNLQLHGVGHIITDMYTTVRVFKTKLSLLKTQMLQGNLGNFPSCQAMAEQISFAVLASTHFAEKVNTLSIELSQRFADFEAENGIFEQH